MSTLFRGVFEDVSFAFKHRAHALIAILAMALGIGATAAVYSVL